MIPTCRPKSYEKFWEAWTPLFDKHQPYIFKVEDQPPWEGIPDFIPRRTDMIRSWGFYQAWKSDTDYVLSLDDDVLPIGDPFEAYESAFNRDWPCSPYLSVGALTDTDLEMRGFPYRDRDSVVAVQYGGWVGVPDLDAATQIASPREGSAFFRAVMPVPKGAAATCCAMNFAFRAHYAPLMWQFPLYEGVYNRFGDIWSGLVQKRCLDALGKVMLINGQASVRHDRASDPFVNLQKEAPGLPLNEGLWDALSYPSLGKDMLNVFKVTTNCAISYFRKQQVSKAYVKHFEEARDQWLALFS